MQLLVLPEARIVAPRFGASDCDCPAHLVLLKKECLNASLLPQAQHLQLR